MILADTPSLGMLIGLPVGLLVMLVATAWTVLWWRTEDFDRGPALAAGIVVGLIAFVATAVAMWPYKHDYHFWKPVNGRVEKINKRLVSDGDHGMSQRFVVVVDGQPYSVDDTRAALLKVGDRVSLSCKREYQWGSHDNGYGCRWNGSVTR